jgi:hypothetical protein
LRLRRGKASSCNTHPDAHAQIEATDKGKKRKLSVKSKVDILPVKQKCQHDERRFKAIKIFEGSKKEKLSWALIMKRM